MHSKQFATNKGGSVLEIIVQWLCMKQFFLTFQTNHQHPSIWIKPKDAKATPSHWSAVGDSDFAEGFEALASSKWNPGEGLLMMVKNDVIVRCDWNPQAFSFGPVNSFKDLQNLSCCCMPMATTCQANQYRGLLSSQSIRTPTISHLSPSLARKLCCKKLPRKVPQVLLYCIVRYPHLHDRFCKRRTAWLSGSGHCATNNGCTIDIRASHFD